MKRARTYISYAYIYMHIHIYIYICIYIYIYGMLRRSQDCLCGALVLKRFSKRKEFSSILAIWGELLWARINEGNYKNPEISWGLQVRALLFMVLFRKELFKCNQPIFLGQEYWLTVD